MRHVTVHRIVALLSIAAVAGCASRRNDLVVVVPDAEGKVGEVRVYHSHAETTLDEAREGVSIDARRNAVPVRLTEEEVRATFGPALAAMPVAPRRFTLYFDEGTDRLVADSVAQLPEILADIQGRSAREVEVIGHTDRLADEGYNATLSERRAGSVRDWLVASGVVAESISIAGRGERDPIVPTDDGVAEPRNRRVEVTVR